eukprot:5159697-Amphidinium_carterae.1
MPASKPSSSWPPDIALSFLWSLAAQCFCMRHIENMFIWSKADILIETLLNCSKSLHTFVFHVTLCRSMVLKCDCNDILRRELMRSLRS